MHNYHDVQKTFPWGTRSWGYGTWAVQTLPFVEKNQIFAEYRWDIKYNIGTNDTLLNNLVISTYVCPSDSNQNKCSYGSYREHNYVVCMGREGVYNIDDYRYPPDYDPRNCLIDGVVFARESQYRAMFTASSFSNVPPSPDYPLTTAMEDVIDGTSNTIALSETVQGVPPGGAINDLRGLIWYGFGCYFNTNQAPNTMVADITHTDFSSTGHTQHPLSPLVSSTTSGDGRYTRFSARSWHVGGVNAGLADGSIRFITNQINLDIWRAAGSTNGGEVVSLP